MILYGLLLAGFVAMLGGAYWTGHSNGVDGQKRVDEPLIAAARAEREVAIQANVSLQEMLNKVAGDVDACNTQVAKIKADSDEAIRNMDLITRESDERKKVYAKIIARYEAQAKATTPVAPDLQCRAARETLMSLSDEMKALDALGLPGGKLTITPVSPK